MNEESVEEILNEFLLRVAAEKKRFNDEQDSLYLKFDRANYKYNSPSL